MGHRFAEIAFTEAVRKQQELHGSRKQYQRMEENAHRDGALGEFERHFIGARDSFYMATVSETGWPYIQYRGGPKGFLHVLDDRTVAFADVAGNKQYISAGNLSHNDRVAIFLMDYVNQARLKVLGHARVLEGTDEASAMLKRLAGEVTEGVVERAFVIAVEAFDWNCPQHIVQRFTIGELQELGAKVIPPGEPAGD